MVWLKQNRVRKVSEIPTISIRKTGISFNAAFVRSIGADTSKLYCELFINHDCTKLGFRFSSEKSEDAYTLIPDGGGNRGGKATMLIACGLMIRKHTNIASIAGRSKLPVLSDENGVLYVNLRPQFTHSAKKKLPSQNESGVYQYTLSGEVVYIGQGRLLSRFSSEQRKEWVFDDIQYLLLEDENARFSLEHALLEEFRQHNGRLPIYNLISGRKRG